MSALHRRLVSVAVAAALLGTQASCQTASPTVDQATAEANFRECLHRSVNPTPCQEQYDKDVSAAEPCTDELFMPWGRMCFGAKMKMLLLAFLGGAARGASRGLSSGVTDTGRYKGYKTYDSTFSSPYGTTHCRTQIGGTQSYTSCD